MKRLIPGFVAGAFVFGGLVGVGTAVAANENGNHGQCTAYFNGQNEEDDRLGDEPSTFDALTPGNEDIVQWVDDGDETYEEGEEVPGTGEQDEASDAYEYCTDDGGEIGGQPEHNGNWDCEEDGAARDVDADGEIECYDNTGLTGQWVDTAFPNDPDAGDDGTNEDETGDYDTGGDRPGNGHGH